MDWIIANKEWLFSGIAIAIPLGILGWYLNRNKNKQVQKSGDNSNNIQVGNNININSSKEDE